MKIGNATFSAVNIIVVVTAVIAIVVASLVFITVLAFKELRTNALKIMAWMTLCGFAASLLYIIDAVLTVLSPGNQGNTPKCKAIGFFFQFWEMALFLWSSCVAVTFLITIIRQDFYERREFLKQQQVLTNKGGDNENENYNDDSTTEISRFTRFVMNVRKYKMDDAEKTFLRKRMHKQSIAAVSPRGKTRRSGPSSNDGNGKFMWLLRSARRRLCCCFPWSISEDEMDSMSKTERKCRALFHVRDPFMAIMHCVFHIFVWGIAGSIAVAMLARDVYGQSGSNLWCWIADEYKDLRIYAFYSVLWLTGVLNAIVYIAIIVIYQKGKRYRIQLPDDTASSQFKRIASGEANMYDNAAAAAAQTRVNNYRSIQRHHVRVAFLYVFVYVVTWLFPSINRLYQLANPTNESPYWLKVMHSLTDTRFQTWSMCLVYSVTTQLVQPASVEEVLKNKNYLKYFLKHMKKTLCLEAVLFWYHCENFRIKCGKHRISPMLVTNEELRATALEIYNLYIEPNSALLELNISSEQRAAITKALSIGSSLNLGPMSSDQPVDPDVFKDLQLQMFDIMHTEFPRFLDSDYGEMLVDELNKHEVYSQRNILKEVCLRIHNFVSVNIIARLKKEKIQLTIDDLSILHYVDEERAAYIQEEKEFKARFSGMSFIFTSPQNGGDNGELGMNDVEMGESVLSTSVGGSFSGHSSFLMGPQSPSPMSSTLSSPLLASGAQVSSSTYFGRGNSSNSVVRIFK